MTKTKTINELLRGTKKLSQLTQRANQRAKVLVEVRSALPERLAESVVSAGLEEGRLSVGVAGAVWASRVRYHLPAVRARLQTALGLDVISVRMRVVPPIE
jgi:hypothetical protein